MKVNKPYDYLIVGAGLFGATFAHEMHKLGKKCLVIDQRNHIGGNTYCKNEDGINVHQYGAHVFHTNDEKIWKYVNGFVTFNRYTNSPIAIYKNQIYNLPFNMNTFNRLWGVVTPREAKEKIKQQVGKLAIKVPINLEEYALSLVGKDIYNYFIKGYSEKQWGRKATELPAFLIKRIPIRFNYDNNYFNDKYQGIPIGGYNMLSNALLNEVEVKLGINYNVNRSWLAHLANTIVYTGPIDEFFEFKLGKLEYRSLRFEHERLEIDNFQGNAVVNYTDLNIPYTRIIEHKHFEFGNQSHTIITREYPNAYQKGTEPYYPVNDRKNNSIYESYKKMAGGLNNIIFGGRLATYKYYNMDQVLAAALNAVKREKQNML
ncbi:UDP-galactopyranose mutase [Fulvivirgaceae bacterium BMA12]|uniref:UDP-galactopyranose mutase n=1 Tax=Agaribacillus aureus TaxID=3051825 RepID=A0ABT8L7K1_9BACT|nr:UDP-galactopyranose mutase [Fulvivirgaceae bacterium BMA12]